MHTIHVNGVRGEAQDQIEALNSTQESDVNYVKSELRLAVWEAIPNEVYDLSVYADTLHIYNNDRTYLSSKLEYLGI